MAVLTLAEIEKLLLQLPGTTKEMPFGPDALVFKVLGKLFAIVAWKSDPLRITLKCDPARAIMLRQQYPAVIPGYHMNKQHWNTVTVDRSIPEDELKIMMNDSYRLVASRLKKADRIKLGLK